jgi:hypothetical protein
MGPVAVPLAPGVPFVPQPLGRFTQVAKVSKVVPKAMEAKAGKQPGMEAEVLDGAKEARAKAKEPREEAKVSFSLVQSSQPPHLLLRKRLDVWKLMGASKELLQVIDQGVLHQWHSPVVPLVPTVRSQADLLKVAPILEEYCALGALKEVPWSKQIRFLIPWFVLSKQDPLGGFKHRLISDCRLLNAHLETTPFKLENIQSVFPLLRKNMWGGKVDLKNAYFHLGVAETAKPYLCLQAGDRFFQWQGAPFGLSVLPYLFQNLMKPLLKKWRAQGILVWVYLDDILVVNSNKTTLQKELSLVLADLEKVGLQVNAKKSVLQPSQTLDYLGFTLNFAQGVLQVPPQKLKTVRRELGKLVTHTVLTPRKVAAILGTVRSFLTALPFLRAFTDQLCQFVKLQELVGWDVPQPLPKDLKDQLVEVKNLLQEWKGRSMDKKVVLRHLQSDASNIGWGGKDLVQKTELQEYWRDRAGLHINIKELHAAVETVKSLARPGELVHLGVDNTVAYSYLKKSGGRKKVFNELMRPFLRWCQENQVQVQVNLVKSSDMQADWLSRKAPDRGDYTLQRETFLAILETFSPHVQPQVDMFSSPGNAQLPLWVSRYPHWGAWGVNALEMDLSPVAHCWANPPWTLISKWLHRLRLAPWVQCLMAVPYWVGSSWWPQLVKMHVKGSPVLLVQPQWGLFQDCQGKLMPPTRWPLLCVLLSGSSWRGNKFRLKVSHHF